MMDYLLAVQAPAYPTANGFAAESAFVEHLRMLRHSIGPEFERLLLVAPQLCEADYRAVGHHLGHVDSLGEGIVLVPAHPLGVSAAGFWRRHARPLWRQLRRLMPRVGVVHSGMSTDLWRPLMAMVCLAGWRARRPVLFFVDIDFRRHSQRLYRLGVWGPRAYVVNRLVHDPLKYLQLRLAPRMFQLVMLKSASMVETFGKGRAHVKNFFDTAYSSRHVLTLEETAARVARLHEGREPLRLVYFGRLAWNKGLDRAVDAVAIARSRGADVLLSVIGDGPCLADLRRRAEERGIGRHVSFFPQLGYGEALFRRLDEAHLSIAAPLIEDTPRAAFDAMARGLPIVAFDITYFRDLAEMSGGVVLAEWPEAESLAAQIVALDRDRARLAAMAERSVAFACANTQELWLSRRTEWMREFALGPARA